MILTDVLTATDLNPMYYNFIPIFIKAWRKLFPEINIHIILIANELIEELESYKAYIKLFKPIDGISTAFIAQNIRLFYPCLLNDAKGGILITDMEGYKNNKWEKILKRNKKKAVKNPDEIFFRGQCLIKN